MSTRTIFVCDACLREVAAEERWGTLPEKWSTVAFSALGEDGRIKRDLHACSQKCTGTILRQLVKDFEAPRKPAPLDAPAVPPETPARKGKAKGKRAE